MEYKLTRALEDKGVEKTRELLEVKRTKDEEIGALAEELAKLEEQNAALVAENDEHLEKHEVMGWGELVSRPLGSRAPGLNTRSPRDTLSRVLTRCCAHSDTHSHTHARRSTRRRRRTWPQRGTSSRS